MQEHLRIRWKWETISRHFQDLFVPINTGLWNNSDSIVINIDGLSARNYIFMISVADESGNTNSKGKMDYQRQIHEDPDSADLTKCYEKEI